MLRYSRSRCLSIRDARLWLGVTFALCIALTGARAEPLRNGNVLHCAVIDVPPFGMHDASGKPKGLLVDMNSAIAKAAGFTCKNRLLPFSRAIQNVGSGDEDLLILYTNPMIERLTWRAGRVVHTYNILLTRKGTGPDRLSPQNQPLLGRMQSGFLGTKYETTPGYSFHNLQKYQQGIRLLMKDRIDGMLAPVVAVAWILDTMPVTDAAFNVPERLNTLEAYLFVNTRFKGTEAGKRLSEATRVFYDSGKGQDMINAYLPVSWRQVH